MGISQSFGPSPDRAAMVEFLRQAVEEGVTLFDTAEVYGPTDDAELRLITCGGRLDTATHSYEDNVVVYARMIRVG